MSETPTTQPTAPSPTMARFAAGLQGNYDLVVAAFCGLLLISNIGATKLISFPTGWDALPVHRHRRRRLLVPAHLHPR